MIGNLSYEIIITPGVSFAPSCKSVTHLVRDLAQQQLAPGSHVGNFRSHKR